MDFKKTLEMYHTAKEGMESLVPQFIKNAYKYDLEERKNITEELTDAYLELTGKTPDASTLYLLGNFILSEDFADTHPDKSSRPYSFKSPRQERKERTEPTTFPSDGLEHTTKNGVPSGFRKTSYDDEQGGTRETRQPLMRFNT